MIEKELTNLYKELKKKSSFKDVKINLILQTFFI